MIALYNFILLYCPSCGTATRIDRVDNPMGIKLIAPQSLNMLRAGVDIFSLQKLMGHADLQVLRRYLAQTTEDIAAAHRMGSPVDMNGF